MRKLAIVVALSSTVLATPALARNGAWYVGGDFGAMIVEDIGFDFGLQPVVPASGGNSQIVINHDYGYDAALFVGYDLGAFRIEGLTGVHTTDGKVAAIGVHIKRWVTTHGFALNVNTDLSYYNWIIACEGEPVTSMDKILGHEVPMAEVEDRLIANFAEVFAETVVGAGAAAVSV